MFSDSFTIDDMERIDSSSVRIFQSMQYPLALSEAILISEKIGFQSPDLIAPPMKPPSPPISTEYEIRRITSFSMGKPMRFMVSNVTE